MTDYYTPEELDAMSVGTVMPGEVCPWVKLDTGRWRRDDQESTPGLSTGNFISYFPRDVEPITQPEEEETEEEETMTDSYSTFELHGMPAGTTLMDSDGDNMTKLENGDWKCPEGCVHSTVQLIFPRTSQQSQSTPETVSEPVDELAVIRIIIDALEGLTETQAERALQYVYAVRQDQA